MPASTHSVPIPVPWEIAQRLDSMAHDLGESTEQLIESVLSRYIAEMQPDKEDTMTSEELLAGYMAMAADEEREAEAREWCDAYMGEDLIDDETR
jgi:predicted DNA-binding protein